MNGSSGPWTGVAAKELERLWNHTNLSAKQIAGQITILLQRPVTKNAVLGQAKRLRDSGVPMVTKSETAAARQERYQTADLKKKAAALAFGTDHVEGWPKKGECAWPIGDPLEKGFRFCCKARGSDHRYCDAHHRMAFRKPGEER